MAKVFLPGQWKKPVKTGKNWQKLWCNKVFINIKIQEIY